MTPILPETSFNLRLITASDIVPLAKHTIFKPLYTCPWLGPRCASTFICWEALRTHLILHCLSVFNTKEAGQCDCGQDLKKFIDQPGDIGSHVDQYHMTGQKLCCPFQKCLSKADPVVFAQEATLINHFWNQHQVGGPTSTPVQVRRDELGPNWKELQLPEKHLLQQLFSHATPISSSDASQAYRLSSPTNELLKSSVLCKQTSRPKEKVSIPKHLRIEVRIPAFRHALNPNNTAPIKPQFQTSLPSSCCPSPTSPPSTQLSTPSCPLSPSYLPIPSPTPQPPASVGRGNATPARYVGSQLSPRKVEQKRKRRRDESRSPACDSKRRGTTSSSTTERSDSATPPPPSGFSDLAYPPLDLDATRIVSSQGIDWDAVTDLAVPWKGSHLVRIARVVETGISAPLPLIWLSKEEQEKAVQDAPHSYGFQYWADMEGWVYEPAPDESVSARSDTADGESSRVEGGAPESSQTRVTERSKRYRARMAASAQGSATASAVNFAAVEAEMAAAASKAEDTSSDEQLVDIPEDEDNDEDERFSESDLMMECYSD